MSTPNAITLLAYANVQMAAETIYPLGFTEGPIQASWLEAGNKRSSRFTPTQAAAFALEWEVVSHKENTGTGFSGTLFRFKAASDASRGLTEGQLVMSLRSTEFADDAARDSQATNKMEIQEFGWAFGQIADMQNWFRSLDVAGGALDGKNVTVTGFCLGGHLASALTRLMVEQRHFASASARSRPVNPRPFQRSL